MADVGRLLETMHPMREPPVPEAIVPYLALLALGCLCAASALVVLWWLRHRRAALRVSVESALAAARGLAPPERLAAQAMLLRRLVRGLVGDEAARAQGATWLEHLDRLFATRFFTQGAGAAFGESLYRRPGSVDVEALDQALIGFVAQLRPSKLAPREVRV